MQGLFAFVHYLHALIRFIAEYCCLMGAFVRFNARFNGNLLRFNACKST